MESQIINTFFFGIIAGLSTISGMYLVLYKKRWAEKNSIFLLSFSAGALLAAAFFHIIPESIELFKNALLTILIGFIFFYLLESIITGHHCHDEQCRLENLSTLALISLGFHSLIDGLIIGIGFEVSLKIGLVATLGVILHEFPEGITVMSIMIHSQIKKTKAMVFSYLVALATPIGAIVSLFLVKEISEQSLGILLSIAAGSFLYIAASDLIPETHRQREIVNPLFLVFGIMIVFLVGFLL